MKRKFWLLNPYFNAEDGGGVGGTGDEPPKTPESVLFPSENEPPKNDDPKPEDKNKGDDETTSEWKEYEPDPNKSDEENAAAKAEHDATKPKGDEGKGDDDKDKKSKEDEAKLDQVPEDGKYELTMPEGVEVDKELLDAITPKLTAKGFTRREAQELTDEFIKVQQKRAEEHIASPEGAWSAVAFEYFREHGTPDTWEEAAKNDEDIGGDKWDGTVANARRFIQAAGTPELKKFFDASGSGNHPEVIRAFAKAGELIREDNPPPGGSGGSNKPADPAYVLFPNDAPKG